MKLQSVNMANGKDAMHVGSFLGFELYEHEDVFGSGDIDTYFVKDGEVVGIFDVSYSCASSEHDVYVNTGFKEISKS